MHLATKTEDLIWKRVPLGLEIVTFKKLISENEMVVETIKLNNGYEMPIFGLGTMFAKDEVGVQTVKDAIDLGYRHFDTAHLYGNEKQVGDGIRAKIEEGVVKREDVFVVTKLWNTYHEPDKVELACRNSCEKLGLGYIDLYLMHSPMGFEYRGDTEADFFPINSEGDIMFNEVDYVDTYKAMEKLVETGLVRSLGVSNFNSEQIDRLLANCQIKPVTNQVEVGPSITQKKLTKFCKDRDIVITGFSPLGRPYNADLSPDSPALAFLDSRVIAIGEKYGKTGAQVVLRYLVDKIFQLGVVLIPKSSNKQRMQENINIFDFELNEEDVALNNGYEMPIFGLGTMFAKDEVGVQTVKDAIDLGYRHFDTAHLYGNEKQVGDGIRAKIEEGVVKREDVFVVTKLWNTYHEPDKVELACRNSCEKLGLGYIDLYLMHSPMGFEYRGDTEADSFPKNSDGVVLFNEVDYVDTYKAMEKLVETGLVRSLGVSNFNSEQIDRLLANCQIKPVTNQVEVGPSITQKKLTKFCKERDIVITGFSPLGRPYNAGLNPDLPKLAFLDPRVIAIGEKYGKTGAQVVLRYLVDKIFQLGVVLIPKSSDKQRMQENINIFNFELNEEEVAVLETFDTGKRTLPLNFKEVKSFNHKYYPNNIEF
ncbi:1,5-anhydro-D-fructose reductase, partial [Pseudolycoriella hygida]